MSDEHKGRIFERMDAAYPDGGYQYPDKELLGELRNVVWDLMKQIGKNLMQGKNLTTISLPVSTCEPRSYLQRISDGWIYAPIYLTRAAQETDPIERMKNVITFALAGLWNTGYPKKPFNPIIGETFQASYEDGSILLVEQASHHPPVTTWQVFGPSDETSGESAWHFYGFGAWSASFKGHNTVRGHQDGPHFVDFLDGCTIEYQLPDVFARGVIYGEQFIEYDGPVRFVDEKNNLCAELLINTGKFLPKSGGWFSGRKKVPSDYFEGAIFKLDDESKTPIVTAEGSYVGVVEFDGKVYWRHDMPLKVYSPQPVESPLASDCRFRQDMVHLSDKDVDAAQDWKVRLEDEQRADAALRKQGAESRPDRLKELRQRYADAQN